MPKSRTAALLLTVAVAAFGLSGCVAPVAPVETAPAIEETQAPDTEPAETDEAAPATGELTLTVITTDTGRVLLAGEARTAATGFLS